MRAESERTDVVQGEERVRQRVLEVLSKVRTRLDVSAATLGPGNQDPDNVFVRALVSLKERGVKPRIITDITADKIEQARLALQLLEMRHVPGLKATFLVTDSEYLSSPVADVANADLPVIFSNARQLVEQHQFIFDSLWATAEPAGERILSLESGSDLPGFEVVRDARKIRDMYLSIVKGAKQRVLLLLPTSTIFQRDERIGVIDALQMAAKRGVRVRILAPLTGEVMERLVRSAKRGKGSIEVRTIPPAETQETVTILVADDVSLTIDERDPTRLEFEESVGLATLITREGRMRANIRFFERSWMESELREAERAARQQEESSRRRAELMQDILTHDIRNFNQVARLNAELLEDETTDKDSRRRVTTILRAIDGSSLLIERTKKLGNILSSSPANLRPMGVKASFERALLLVRRGNPEKKIEAEVRLTGDVLADGLLDEIFANLLTNSVKYTETQKVRILAERKAAEVETGPGNEPRKFWKISITDWGRGIPDSMKPNVFRRYLESAKGSGLGMSIVHALVSERYGGKVQVRDRVEGDHRKGTVVEIWLPRN